MNINKKKIARIVAVLLTTFVMGVIGLYAYVSSHKEEMLSHIESEFKESFNGTLEIKNIRPNLWKQFPNICFELQGVRIRDTQWAKHHHDFLNIERLYVKIRFFPIFVGKLSISKLILSGGKLMLFEDENGFSNKSIFAKKKKKKKGNNLGIYHFGIENFSFQYQSLKRNKDFDFYFDKLQGNMVDKGEKQFFRSSGKMFVKQCTFNTEKGAFFKNKNIRFNFAFNYRPEKNTINFEEQHFLIEKERLKLSGMFALAKESNYFTLKIVSPTLQYAEAISWLSPNIFEKLHKYDFAKPISLVINISGKLTKQRTPKVTIAVLTQKNTLKTNIGNLDTCSFSLAYNNGQDTSLGDEYAQLKVLNLSTNYKGIHFSADSTLVENLKTPKVSTHIQSNFEVEKLNAAVNTKTFAFKSGRAKVDLYYSGKWNRKDSIPTKINGTLIIQKANLSYVPRNINFKNCDLNLFFDNDIIRLKNSTLNTDRSSLQVDAISKNFINEFYSHPERIVIAASLKSDKINLNEFQSFLQKRRAAKKQMGKSPTDYLDDAFGSSTTHLDIAVKELLYKKFKAKRIVADISLLQNEVSLNNVSLQHAQGVINMSGKIEETSDERSSFRINADIQDAMVDTLLHSFDNFGQTTFKPNNINGIISIKTQLNGNFDKNAQLIIPSLKGYASIELNKAHLINFEPLERMGKLFFRKKRLANVQFEQVKNTFTIDGERIKIPPMWVNTDLIDLQIEGIYNLKIGTDLLLEIPLFKFTKEDIEESPELSNHKGFRLYIRGKDDEKGNLKFSLKMRNEEINAAREERKRNKELRKRNK